MLQSVFTNARERLEQDGNLPSPVQSEQEEDDQEDDDDDQDSPKKRGRGPDKKVGLIFSIEDKLASVFLQFVSMLYFAIRA